jgi:hypothetical protein
VLSSSVPNVFEFDDRFSKPARLALSGFSKLADLHCRLFKRELFIGNMFGWSKLA